MRRKSFPRRLALGLALLLCGCATATAPIPFDTGTATPGQTITRGGTPMQLLGDPVKVGAPLPAVALLDANLKEVDLSKMRGEVLFLSIVPSIDTGICERQTRILGEAGDRLSDGVRRITVSRDLPFAQKRFADEGALTDLLYLSDFKEGAFGRATGLLVDELRLLARSIILVDRGGTIRYIQVVPEMGHLPDMEKAFAVARALARE